MIIIAYIIVVSL